jgi:arabinofuranosyltransferase
MLQVAGAVGLLVYYAGPEVHVLDVFGLGDPFLARLPSEPGWRIGHFQRHPRVDYVESLRVGDNRIVDPEVALYYDKLSRITRGELFDRERLRTIVAFNRGRYDHLLDGYLARKSARLHTEPADKPH